MKTVISLFFCLALAGLGGCSGSGSGGGAAGAPNEGDGRMMGGEAGTPAAPGESDAALATAAGGQLNLLGGRVQLAVPAGALSAQAEITVTRLPDEEGVLPGMNYQFGPDGLTFERPVRLTLTLPSDLSEADRAQVGVVSSKGGRELESIATTVGGDGTVSAEIIGF